jgi:hypothetical protein
MRKSKHIATYECLEAFVSGRASIQHTVALAQRSPEVQCVFSRMDGAMTPNKSLQTGKVKLSCLLRLQKPRQSAFAAELGR